MKKNMLAILILALCILNVVLGAVIVFTVVPTTVRTNNLITKVSSAIDLELSSSSSSTETQAAVVDVADLEGYPILEDSPLNLKKDVNDTVSHYALVSVSLSLNKKSKDYKSLQPTIETNKSNITEIISDEFSKYTFNNVSDNKENIKVEILRRIQEYFKSDFITNISFGKFITQ
jgi:flagellar FliL protein